MNELEREIQKGYESGYDDAVLRMFLHVRKEVELLKCRCGEAPMASLCRRCIVLSGRDYK